MSGNLPSKTMTNQKIVKKSKLIEKPTYKSLQNVATEGKKQHGKSQKTTGAYDGYICRGKDFLKQFADDAKNDLDVLLSGEDEDGSRSLSKAKMDPEFHRAFEGQPTYQVHATCNILVHGPQMFYGRTGKDNS
jgi:hypothetical protein